VFTLHCLLCTQMPRQLKQKRHKIVQEVDAVLARLRADNAAATEAEAVAFVEAMRSAAPWSAAKPCTIPQLYEHLSKRDKTAAAAAALQQQQNAG
jgi:hypothetical protein